MIIGPFYQNKSPAFLYNEGSCEIISITACGSDANQKGQTQKDQARKAEKINEESSDQFQLPTQEEFENQLSDMGIPVYPGAEFHQIQKPEQEEAVKGMYYIPDKSPETIARVGRYYDSVIVTNFPEDKYKLVRVSDNMIIVQKNDKNVFSFANSKALKSQKHLLQLTLNKQFLVFQLPVID